MQHFLGNILRYCLRSYQPNLVGVFFVQVEVKIPTTCFLCNILRYCLHRYRPNVVGVFFVQVRLKIDQDFVVLTVKITCYVGLNNIEQKYVMVF